MTTFINKNARYGPMDPRKLMFNTIIFIILLAWFAMAATRIFSGECMGKALVDKTDISEHSVRICDCSGMQYQARRLGEEPSQCCFGFAHGCYYQVDLNNTGSPNIQGQEYFAFFKARLDATYDKDQTQYFTYAILPVVGSHQSLDEDALTYSCSSLINEEAKTNIRLIMQPVQTYDAKHALVPFIVDLKKTASDKYKCLVSLDTSDSKSLSATIYIDR